MDKYVEPEYAATRLNETIVRLNGVPIMVTRVDEDGTVVGYYLNSLRSLVTTLNEIDINPVDLGYCNREVGEAIYLTRAPMREDWRQGLRHNTLRTSDGRRADYITLSELGRTIEGSFPTMMVALGRVMSKAINSLAFSRDWAFNNQADGDVIANYKGMSVGLVDPRSLTITLAPRFNWLNETLEEVYHAR